MSLRFDYDLDAKAKLSAFKYQEEAYLSIRDLPYAAIFHEQGLGKTKIAIDTLLYWLSSCDIDTVLIVTKKTLVQNWVNEFATHTNIKPEILSANKKSNFYILNSPQRVIITNFETISSEKYRISLFLKTRNVAVIIDESAKIKNPESKLTKDFLDLANLFQRKIIMSGTPVANRPYDIWSQIYFLDLGKSLGSDFASFKKSTDLSNELEKDALKLNEFEKSVSSIFSQISSFTVRETKNSGIISLPNKIYHDIIVSFENKQFELYDTLRTELKITLQKGDETILDESQESIKRLLRLVQIASNPALIDDGYKNVSAKESKLDELIKSILENEESVIVWSIFTDNVDYFCRKYQKYGAVRITGKMDVEARNVSIRKFKDGEAKILFATPQSAKEGLTLTVANHSIFYDRGFNLDDYLQAQDRIHRISQTRDCHIYNLMIQDSIDIWIDYLLLAKQEAAHLAQGDCTLSQYKENADYSFSHLVHEILNTPK